MMIYRRATYFTALKIAHLENEKLCKNYTRYTMLKIISYILCWNIGNVQECQNL